MNKKARFYVLPVFLAFALIMAACAPQNTAPQPTDVVATQPAVVVEPTAELPDTAGPGDIVDIAAGDMRFSTLVTAVQAAGLADTLKSEGPFTVFAPTDEAFAKLPAGTLDALLADTDQLSDILLYHVVPGEVMAADVVAMSGQQVDTALEGAGIDIQVSGDMVLLNGDVQVLITDIQASNGVIHVIDSVLLPPTEDATTPSGTIVDLAAGDERFSTLVSALQSADLVETLQGEGPFTVFAPTDEAFASLPAGTLEALTVEQLTDILLYHVVPGKVMAADVAGLDGQNADTALDGAQLAISVENGMVYLNENVQVIITDLEATNGVIHVIDAVLLPPSDEAGMESEMQDIVAIAAGDERFSTLVSALQTAGLVETLQGEGPFTVFAPTDEAFASLPAGTLEALTVEQLTDILLYHVVGGKVMAEQVLGLDGETVITVLGQPVTITIENGTVMVNDAMVIITDIEASNGVIHVIDMVLLPAQ